MSNKVLYWLGTVCTFSEECENFVAQKHQILTKKSNGGFGNVLNCVKAYCVAFHIK